jgi:hypothetical protein
MAFASETKEQFGMSCAEAVKRGILRRGSRLNYRTGNVVADGWENSLGGGGETQSEALADYFRQCAAEQAKRNAELAGADYLWGRADGGNGPYRIVSRDGQTVCESSSRLTIIERLEALEADGAKTAKADECIL